MENEMNERIRELSEQAEKYADDNFRGEPTWSEAFESKFAELIVRECADIASINQHQYNAVGEYVLKHFGVES
jgi:hypothetical protein